MKVVRRPKQHLIHFLLLILVFPIFALNLWVIEKGQFVKFLASDRVYCAIVPAILIVLIFYFLMKAQKRALVLLGALSLSLVGINLYFLLTTKNYALAFFCLFLIILSSMYLLSTYRILFAAYYNAKKKWFAGKPRFIPQILAEIEFGEGKVDARLSNIDFEGCYVFSEEKGPDQNPKKIKFTFKDKILACNVKTITRMKRCADDTEGWGFSFINLNADGQKDINDFIECVRSAGYVR